MIKTQPIKKYIAPAIVATSIAVFSPVLIDEASAHGGPDIEESNNSAQTSNAEENTSSSSDSSEAKSDSNSSETEATNGGITLLSGNAEIGEVQQKLRDKGYNLAADGLNGPKTETSLKSLQADEGIQVDGIVGDDTADALGISTASATGGESSGGQDGNKGGGDDEPSAPAQTTSAIGTAESLVGSPYVAGGTTPDGFDSSGFINYIFKQNGVKLDRTHEGMWANNGTKVSDPQPGDVVFFENTYKPGVSHSGIYLGNDKMIHAGTEDTGVEVTSTEIDYWSSRYIGAKRF